MLARHTEALQEVKDAYESYQFRRVFQVLLTHVSSDLSAFYLDTAKDRLYIQDANSASRRACQTVAAALLRGLLSALAPVAPHLAEDAWLNLPWPRPRDSVFEAGWAPDAAAAGGALGGGAASGGAEAEQYWRPLDAAEAAAWDGVLAAREAANAVLAKARDAKLIGPSLEAAVHVHVSEPAVAAALEALAAAGNGADEPRFIFIASEVHLADSADAVRAAVSSGGDNGSGSSGSGSGSGGGIVETVETAAAGAVTIGVARAAGRKCARCWNFSAAVGSADAEHPELCERCAPVVRAQGFKLPNVAAAAAAAPAAAPVAAA